MQLQLTSTLATSMLLFTAATAQLSLVCRGSDIVFGGPCFGNSNSCQCNTGTVLSGNCNGQGAKKEREGGKAWVGKEMEVFYVVVGFFLDFLLGTEWLDFKFALTGPGVNEVVKSPDSCFSRVPL
ncbi:hypothetical protein COCMIDRAFT_21696 [Bipolaris oryzae ATCC 44560]|uniref:Uncharacterized protein n=1 Tax=Bipolaris oryzae ATCC 44560 TaxID=930090 RepID=W6ZGM0_COCMI|nr:uncharacterized protein COCMIDRAFT_21696 [Bipolaris oryzae ATCC 44560]EUC50987.1 hypothetical protein COCMIDRAFT_21696 [Bipolaris oryzae ATCC 44560]